MSLPPRRRVERALRRQPIDKTPFSVYESLFPRSIAARKLRRRGLCLIYRREVLKGHNPDTRRVETRWSEAGKSMIRVDVETPCGPLTEIREDRGFTDWWQKHFFAGPEDYKKLIAMVDNARFEPDYARFAQEVSRVGPDAIFRSNVGYEPLQQIMLMFMGIERFCIEWMERRDEVLRLYKACVRKRRRTYRLLAESPCGIFNYGGNVAPEILGPSGFEEYYLPHYNEAAEVFHAHGKLIGGHLDGNCGLLADLIARSALDYVEGFTPAPVTDMTMAQATSVWSDKALWINFPSSVHLQPAEQIAATARELLEATRDHGGFVISITEDVPAEHRQKSFRAIMDAVDAFHASA